MEPLPPLHTENLAVLEAALGLQRAGAGFVLATVVEASGSTPRQAGAKMIVAATGETTGTVGGGVVESRVIEKAKALLATGEPGALLKFDLTAKAGQVCGGAMAVFLENFARPRRVVIFGAGHVGAAVCRLLTQLGWLVTVYDEREERLKLPEFASAIRIAAPYAELQKHVAFDPELHVLIMTPNHEHDFEVLEKVHGGAWAFLGVLGSQRKKEHFLAKLRAAGVAHDTIAKVRIPVGLGIGSETPAEIAVSIAAELIRLHANPERLRD